MPGAIPFQTTCCVDCDDPTTVNVPGPAGAAGAAGATGTAGKNAYTTLTADWTLPAVTASSTATVADSTWATIGQMLIVSNSSTVFAYVQLTAKPSSTQMTLKNVETVGGAYADNAAAGTVFALGGTVSPSGIQGQQGTAGTDGHPDKTYVTYHRHNDPGGDNDLPNSLALNDLALGFMINDPNLTWGLDHIVTTPSIQLGTTGWVSGQLPIANGGTGQSTKTAAFDALAPTAAKGQIIAHDGTDNVLLAAGTDTYVLTADSTAAAGVKWSAVANALSHMAILRDVKSAGTAASTVVTGDWRTVILNSETDVGAILALAANAFTFTATGNYFILAMVPGYVVDGANPAPAMTTFVTRLRNTSSSTTLLSGMNAVSGRMDTASGIVITSFMLGRFTVSDVSHTHEVQVYPICPTGTITLGRATAVAAEEVYSQVFIIKDLAT